MKTLKLGTGMKTINLTKPTAFLATSHQGEHADQHGAFEVFWVGSCSPGCLPEGDAQGPFDSSYEAWVDARAGLE